MGDYRLRWHGLAITSIGYPTIEDARNLAESIRDEVDNSPITGEKNNNYEIVDGDDNLKVVYDSMKEFLKNE